MPHQIKILHAAETIKGGVETVIDHLVHNESEIGTEFTYCFVFPKSQVDATHSIYGASAYHFLRARRNLSAMFSFSLNLCRAIYQERPDVVHLHSSFAGILGRLVCLLMKPIRRPSVVYCPHAFSFMMEISRLRRSVFTHLEKILAFATSRIICVSRHEMNAAIASGLPEERLILIQNGTPAVTEGRRHAIPEGPIRLLYVGRFDYQKGVDILCEALRRIPGDHLQLTAIGGGVNELGEAPDFPPGTRLLGWVDRASVQASYLEADVLVVPSRWEGFAMTPLEGMAHGLPVVASRCTSLPELVEDGVNGYTFATGSSADLAAVLRRLDRTELTRMRPRAMETISARFSVHSMIQKTQHLYRELTGGARP